MNEAISHGFLLPHDLSVDRLISLLGGSERCRLEGSSDFALAYYDSFDWRLHAAGLRLLRVASAQGGVLRLKPAAGGEPGDEIDFDGEPAWPADLPHGTLRERVAGLLAMRILLPLVGVQGEATELSLLNEDAKTVVRLQLLRLSCSAPDLAQPRALWPRLRLLPVRGYEQDLRQLASALGGEQEWPAAPDCLFDEAVTAVGREPGDYSSKLDVRLKPDQMAVDALRKVLLTLLDTLEQNIPGTRADLDSEFLHDLRVATRRTRSALTQVKHVLPDAVVAEFRQRFAWLGQITGPTRDLDVFLLELPRYRASLPLSMAGDLDTLEQHLREAQRREQAKLKRKLGSREMRALLHDWRAVLEAAVPPGEAGWFADLPVERVASQRIWRMYRRVLKAGRAITPASPPEALHALRKDCKKLRYLIEFFRGIYPAKDLKGIVRALKELLDNLGDYQDKEVQAERLKAFAQDFSREDPHGLDGVLAIGALVADLLRGQQAAHERFAECFAHFDSDDNRGRYKHLFKARSGPLG